MQRSLWTMKNRFRGNKHMRTAKHTLTDFLDSLTRTALITALAVFGVAGESLAESVLTSMDHHAAGDGRVEIRLNFDGALPSVQAFSTDEPPRIVLDLADTINRSDTRRLAIGSGATSAVTLLEAAGKTRVVVDLFRATAYATQSDGASIVLTVDAATTEAAPQAQAVPLATTDPAKRLPNAPKVKALDFKRTEDGGGQLALAFNMEGVAADLNDEDGRITVRFPGVELSEGVAQRVDVTDFATPVRTASLTGDSAGAKLELMVVGAYESMAYQAGQDFIVEVRQLSPEAAVDAAGIGVEAEKKGYSGTPVTFNFQNIPVRTVLQLIAEESGLNIVASDTVTGNVTLRLVNVPWDQALDIVLRAKTLDQRRQENVVWVAPQAEIADYEQAVAEAKLALEDRAELVTEYIPVNYGSAEEIAALLTEDAKQGQSAGGGSSGGGGSQQPRSGFLSARGSVTFDKRTNTLLLNDTVEKVIELKALIALLDRPVDQVLIEARIVVASESFARELGARFGISAGYEDSNGNILTSAGSITGTDRMANTALINRFNGQGSGLPAASPSVIGGGVLVPSLGERLNVNLPVIAPSGSLGFALLGADYLLDLELSALEVEGRGEVVSSPRVITANQREAVIRQGDEVGYVTIGQSGGGGIPIPTVEFKPVLLELTVTPTITQDGRVYLVMKIVKDEVSGFIDTSIGSVPQISKREISTAVLMNNAQTVVVGGVYEFESREDLNKVPFLGDVPVLGNLFRKKGRSSEKAELLVFVTPRVVPVSGPK